MVYGGWCGHDRCYHNSLHELNTINLEWSVLASSEAEQTPIKKCRCGIVEYSSGGEEQLCVFGGYGVLNSAASHPTAQYEEYGDGNRVYTNELHIFTSGEQYVNTHSVHHFVLLVAFSQFLYVYQNVHSVYHDASSFLNLVVKFAEYGDYICVCVCDKCSCVLTRAYLCK